MQAPKHGKIKSLRQTRQYPELPRRKEGIINYHEKGRECVGGQIFLRGRAGEYKNYADAVEAAGGRVCLSENIGEAVSCAALLLPGGGDLEPWRYGQENTASRGLDPARDREELALLETFTVLRRPVLGICRGLQTVNIFFGGTLLQDIPGHSQTDGRDRLHPVRTAPSPLRVLYGKNAVVNSAHHQAADRLGTGLEAVQWTPDGTVEALFHRTLPVWAVQWHPERLRGGWARPEAVDGDRLFRAFLEMCRSA